MHVAIVLVTLLSQCAWAWDWWPFSEVEETRLAAAKVKEQYKEEESRPLHYRAPVQISTANLLVDMSKSTNEMTCRYELSQNLVREEGACKGEGNLKQISRIATVCHYRANGRMDSLPPHCETDVNCAQKMSSEAFGVYSTLNVYAETICRELSSEAWRSAVEGMMESLANIADSAIATLHETHKETLRFHDEQRIAAKELKQELDSASQQYSAQAAATLRHFEDTQHHLEAQQEYLKGMQHSMQDLTQVVSKFDEIQAFFRMWQLNNNSESIWSLAKIADLFRFYFASLVWIRFTCWLFAHHEFVSGLRNVQLIVFISALALELAYPSTIVNTNGYNIACYARIAVITCAPLCILQHMLSEALQARAQAKRNHNIARFMQQRRRHIRLIVPKKQV